MKCKENCGVDSSTLKKGYSNTGGIPEEGNSVFSTDSGEAAEASGRAHLGMEAENNDGGFLDRNNTDDRY